MNNLQIVIVTLGEEFYGLDISKVINLIEYTKPSAIRNKKKFVKGVINLRGKVIPILDLREILGYKEGNDLAKRKIAIVQANNEDESVGLIVDDVLSTVDNIQESDVEAIEKLGVQNFPDSIVAAIKLEDKLVAMLDVDKILEESNSSIELLQQ